MCVCVSERVCHRRSVLFSSCACACVCVLRRIFRSYGGGGGGGVGGENEIFFIFIRSSIPSQHTHTHTTLLSVVCLGGIRIRREGKRRFDEEEENMDGMHAHTDEGRTHDDTRPRAP